MSSIWGAVSLNGIHLNKELNELMEKQYRKYRIDRFSHYTDDNVIMGCGHQYLNKEARMEMLPRYDKETGILFTADVVLDNREELLNSLTELEADAPDGLILYHAYKKWGMEFTSHIIGVFSCAFYDYKKRTGYLFTDHMGSRSLYYQVKDNILYFSTIMNAIRVNTRADFNRKWVTCCLSSVSADMNIYAGMTPYSNIYQLRPGRYLEFSDTGVKERSYWNPRNYKNKWNSREDNQYRKIFIDTFQKCTESMMRSIGKTGCTLSGGLDSSSVAALAAIKLNETGDKLYSYTSIPLKDYVSDLPSYNYCDESAKVKTLCQEYNNIVPAYLACEGKNEYSDLDKLIPLLEYPMKSSLNLIWLNEIYQQASQNGCKLMLKGQYGNSTVSYGNILTTLYQEMVRFHFLMAYRQLKGFSRKNHVPRKYVCKIFLKCLYERYTDKWEISKGCVVSKELLKKYKVEKAFQSTIKHSGGGDIDSEKERINFMFCEQGLMQLGAFDTKISLMYGLLVRDPTKDIRMVELCCKLPITCSMSGDLERGMIRSYMEGIVPDIIIKDTNHRGFQSADSKFRIIKDWDSIKNIICTELSNSKKLLEYVDKGKYQLYVKRINNTSISNIAEDDIRWMLVLYSMAVFLKNDDKRLQN